MTEHKKAAVLAEISLKLAAFFLVAWAAVIFSGVFATAFAAWQVGTGRIGANRVLVYQYLIILTGVAPGTLPLPFERSEDH